MAANVALLESSQERNHLNGFAQPHLISDDPSSLLAVKFPEPLHTSLLISEREGRRGGKERGREGEGERGEGGWGGGEGERGEGGREGREEKGE